MNELMPLPPVGYQFTTGSGVNTESIIKFSRRPSIEPYIYSVYKTLLYGLPLSLMKGYFDGFMARPRDADIIYGSLPFRVRKPYVVEFDTLWVFVSSNIRYVKLFQHVIERNLASTNCKRILYWFEHSKAEIMANLECSKFEHKLEKLPLAVHKKDFLKKYDHNKVRILFLGSANVSGAFEMRGGLLVLEAIKKLTVNHKNVEFIIRSDISQTVRQKYADILNLPQVIVIDKQIPRAELEELYRRVDIFLLPAYYDNWLAVLEAMSYELPVIVTDIYASAEIVDNNKTGLLINQPKGIPYYINGIRSPGGLFNSDFRRAIKTPNPEAVHSLIEKTNQLIEDQALRKRMGEAGRHEIEFGRYSIEHRNKVLKRVFDEALSCAM